MTSIDRFTGTIGDDAPGIAQRMRRLFSPEDYSELVRAYADAFARGAYDEGAVPREAGVNFSPRPARVLSILLDDAGIRSVRLLLTALERCVGAEVTGDEGIVIDAAIALDTIRHMHRVPGTPDAKQRYLDDTTSRIVPMLQSAEVLKNKLEHAIGQQRRIVSSQSLDS